MARILLFFSVILLVIPQACTKKGSAKSGKVKIYEETMTIPTYLLGEPEKNPMFNTYENYQIAHSRIYPYPLLDKITDEKVEKEYTGLFLENEYIKICVLPEIGGRIYIAEDKSNDYDFIYHNEVIKPALIGMNGAWISGGIEWNIPHHHRVSAFMPVDYTLTENADGSKTIWVGEYEKRHHTKWLVGVTVFPGKSYAEVEFKLFNSTPTAKSALVWFNPAVHVNEDYQVIFPPDVTKAVYHQKIQFTDWPVSIDNYMGLDFTEGVDVSWWKNTMSPTSFFAWGTKYDFLAGIDHGKRAGTVFVADHHIFPGKKMWNWGNNEVARLWDEILTDSNGPYIELMMGAYSDNQPDYSWYHPYSVRKGKMQFYPVKEMKSIKQASKDLAVNLELHGDTAFIQLAATDSYRDLSIVLNQKNELISEFTFDIDPGQTLKWNVGISSEGSPTDLELKVLTEEGKELLGYQPHEQIRGPHPEVYKPPNDPSDYEDIEDLYLVALRLEQFNDPEIDPGLYWDEILKRDPDNIRANTHLGMKQLENFDYEGAEKRLKGVAERVTANYTSPKFCEALYYLGVARMHTGKPGEAYEVLNQAAWSLEWASAAYYLIAVLDCSNHDFEKAIQHLDLSLEANINNIEALQLKATILRHMGQYKKAYVTTGDILALDPMNFIAIFEQELLNPFYNTGTKPGEAKESFRKMMRDEPDNYLEAATRYGNAGFYNDAVKLLEIAAGLGLPRLNSYPMIHYHLGYYNEILGEKERAIENFKRAGNMQRDYCFPHLNASEKVLKTAIGVNPGDANAHYYLGNLYCNSLPEKSVELWEKAIEFDPTVAVYYRNIAFVLANYNDEMDRAAINIRKATELDTSDPLYLVEQDQYLEYMNSSPELRLKLLEANIETVNKSDGALARYVDLLVINGEFDDAIEILGEWHFHSAEDIGPNVHEQWTDAHMLRGRMSLEAGNYEQALSDFGIMTDFPRNLESARNSRIGLADYYIAESYRLEGNSKLATEHYQKMVDYKIPRGWREVFWPDIQYYKAIAYRKLGDNVNANNILNELIRRGRQMVSHEPHPAKYFLSVKRRQILKSNRAKGYFSMGLGYLGSGNSPAAKEMFNKALAENASHQGTRLFIKELSVY